RECDRAVDRIDHPARALRAAFGAILLAEDPVIRKSVAQRRANRALGLAIGFGDGRPVALCLYRDAAKAREHLAARAVGRRLSGTQRVFERQRHPRSVASVCLTASELASQLAQSAERIDPRAVAVAPVD